MRVMQVMAGADHGGAEAFFTRLVLALNDAGLEQKVVIRNNEPRAAALNAGGIDPVQMSFGGFFDLRTPFAVKREIREFKPDIVLTWMNRATRMCRKGDFAWVARLGGYYDLKYYKGCDHLIGNTEDIVQHLVAGGWPEERGHYLPNFVNEQRMPPISRREFYTPDRSPLLLTMGRLHANKAFDVLLHALARIPMAYLWIAGEGPLRRELEELAELLGVKPRVRFLGWRGDVAALYAACDIFICPSRHEPFGNVVIEAWAHEVPVIAADSLGPGILIQDMKNGILVPVEDAEGLSQAIKFLIGDAPLRHSLGAAGRRTYEENFTEATVIKKYMAFFKSVLN